jgi:tRNA threonylcarbamoyladenosine biosynthesis protein TsaB
MARALPIVGLPTLDALAASQPLLDMPMAAVLRAGRGRLAVGWYHVEKSAWQPARKFEALTPQDLAERIQSPTLVCGELTAEERKFFARERPLACLASPARSLRRPGYLAELAWKRWQAGKTDDPASLAPVYLHYNEPIPE